MVGKARPVVLVESARPDPPVCEVGGSHSTTEGVVSSRACCLSAARTDVVTNISTQAILSDTDDASECAVIAPTACAKLCTEEIGAGG